MSASAKYAATGAGAIALVVLGLWPFLDGAGRNGLLVAAAVAIPVQVGAFGMLNHYRGRLNGFLAAWVGGTMVRMVVIAIAAILVVRSNAEGAVVMLLAMAGFFFGLLLLEPVFFSARAERDELTNR